MNSRTGRRYPLAAATALVAVAAAVTGITACGVSSSSTPITPSANTPTPSTLRASTPTPSPSTSSAPPTLGYEHPTLDAENPVPVRIQLEKITGWSPLPDGFEAWWHLRAMEMCDELDGLAPKLIEQIFEHAGYRLEARDAIAAEKSARLAAETYCPELMP